jgi:hypothetical protein
MCHRITGASTHAAISGAIATAAAGCAGTMLLAQLV